MPGPPKDHDKSAAIIVAAQELFHQHGYDGMTMQAVAAAAGVAKMTVYGHFHDKAALFYATIHAKCAEMLAGLADLPMRLSLGLIGSLSPSEIAQRARRGAAVFLRAYG